MESEPVSFAMIEERLAGSEIALARTEMAKLAAYYSLLIKWNRVFNLTGVRLIDELLDRHLVECLALRELLSGERVADIGTGAGLPGMPLAISEPERRFTLIESRAKRVRFLRHAIGELPVRNAKIEHCRAEDLPIPSPFDTVLARAVAPPLAVLPIARRLTAPGSRLLILTSVERSASIHGLAADFELISIEPAAASARGSVVVQLERTKT